MDNIMGSNYDGHKPVLVAPIKVFTCKYCGRKFLNSRALGGHQNAHKKERTIWMMGVSSRKSLGMETHSLFREPVQEELSTGEAIRSFQRIADSWRKQKFKEGADQDSGWPGSFHVDSSGSNGQAVTASSNDSNMHDLDLDLHL